MGYEIVLTEIFAGCLFATAAVAFHIRQETIRNPGLRTKVSRKLSGLSRFAPIRCDDSARTALQPIESVMAQELH
jgi:hypothetical protein